MTDTSKRDRARASVQAAGGVHQSEIVIPSLILMQGQSPQLKDEGTNARVGGFYHPLLNKDFGRTLRVVILRKRMTHELWGDRDSKQGLLAVADENGRWDKPNHEFEVPYSDGTVIYKTKRNLAESGLSDFGSWKPRTMSKRPATALCYRMLFWLPDHPRESPVAVTLRRMPAVMFQKECISRWLIRGEMGELSWEQVFKLTTVNAVGGGQTYISLSCMNDGAIDDPELSEKLERLTILYSDANVIHAGEKEDQYEAEVEAGEREQRNQRRNYNRDADTRDF
ncbi:MAG: hypothetical protein ABWY64_16950 [Tardiphaga sp.]